MVQIRSGLSASRVHEIRRYPPRGQGSAAEQDLNVETPASSNVNLTVNRASPRSKSQIHSLRDSRLDLSSTSGISGNSIRRKYSAACAGWSYELRPRSSRGITRA